MEEIDKNAKKIILELKYKQKKFWSFSFFI